MAAQDQVPDEKADPEDAVLQDRVGKAIGLGGDRLALWSHPAEAVVAFADGGWSRTD
jgi:hypothetical protein